jgi:hypothetical protein
MLPMGRRWAQVAVFPSMEIGMPVMAFRKGAIVKNVGY